MEGGWSDWSCQSKTIGSPNFQTAGRARQQVNNLYLPEIISQAGDRRPEMSQGRRLQVAVRGAVFRRLRRASNLVGRIGSHLSLTRGELLPNGQLAPS